EHALGSHRNLWAIVEAAHHLAFRTLLELIGGQVQACLNQRMIKQVIIFATGHKREASHIGEHYPVAILAIEAQQRAFWWMLVCRQIPPNGRNCLAQFLSISAIPTVPKPAEPLITVCLSNRCPRSHDFPTLAAPVARCTDVIQSAKSERQVVGLGKCALA